MRYVIFWTAALTLLFSLSSRSDDHMFRYGLGVIEGSPTTQVKQFALREESHEFHAIHTATEIGIWSDTGDAQGRRSSGYITYQLGVKPQGEYIYFTGFIGPALITTTDSQLGGIFQFASDFGIGFSGTDRTSFIHLGAKHISSAGLWSPNKGRDSLLLSLGISL